jgi:hypothetical protein
MTAGNLSDIPLALKLHGDFAKLALTATTVQEEYAIDVEIRR